MALRDDSAAISLSSLSWASRTPLLLFHSMGWPMKDGKEESSGQRIKSFFTQAHLSLEFYFFTFEMSLCEEKICWLAVANRSLLSDEQMAGQEWVSCCLLFHSCPAAVHKSG